MRQATGKRQQATVRTRPRACSARKRGTPAARAPERTAARSESPRGATRRARCQVSHFAADDRQEQHHESDGSLLRAASAKCDTWLRFPLALQGRQRRHSSNPAPPSQKQRCGGQSLLTLPALTIGRSLQTWPALRPLAVWTAAVGRWQIVTTGTRAPRGRGERPVVAPWPRGAVCFNDMQCAQARDRSYWLRSPRCRREEVKRLATL